MICINQNCRACKDHFVNQKVYKECYSDKEFINDCETYKEFSGLTNANALRAREKGDERHDRR